MRAVNDSCLLQRIVNRVFRHPNVVVVNLEQIVDHRGADAFDARHLLERTLDDGLSPFARQTTERQSQGDNCHRQCVSRPAIVAKASRTSC